MSQKPFAATDGTTLHFGPDSTKTDDGGSDLYVYPNSQNFAWGKAYALKTCFIPKRRPGNGKIGRVLGATSFLTPTLSGSNLTNQSVKLEMDGSKTPGQMAANSVVGQMQGMANRMNGLLSSAPSGSGSNSGLGSGLAMGVSENSPAPAPSAGFSGGDANTQGAFNLQIRPYYAHQNRSGLLPHPAILKAWPCLAIMCALRATAWAFTLPWKIPTWKVTTITLNRTLPPLCWAGRAAIL
jgi:hypothetical protein